MNLLESFLEYLLLEKNYSKHTLTAYQKDIIDFLAFLKSEFSMEEVKEVLPSHIRLWLVFLHKTDISNRSINRKITSLKTFYTYLQKIGELNTSPLEHQKSLKIEKKVIIPFSEREIEEAMQFHDDTLTTFENTRNKLLIHFLYATGIRQSELIGVKMRDVDVANQTIKVLGKRNKERIVPIYKEVLEDIKSYILHRAEVACVDDHLFVTSKGRKMYNTLVYRIINSYFSKVSTKQKKSPHVLRHSYATDLVDNGADLNSVKELLGHSSLAATQVYTHNNLEKLKKAYNQAHPRSAKKK